MAGRTKLSSTGRRLLTDDGETRLSGEDCDNCCGCWKIAIRCNCGPDTGETPLGAIGRDIDPDPGDVLYVSCDLITEAIVFEAGSDVPPSFGTVDQRNCYTVGPNSTEVDRLPDGAIETSDLTNLFLSCADCCRTKEACCDPDGTCTDVFRRACLEAGGTPQGVGTHCSDPDVNCDLPPICCDIFRAGDSECFPTGGRACGVRQGSSVTITVNSWIMARLLTGGEPPCQLDCERAIDFEWINYAILANWSATLPLLDCSDEFGQARFFTTQVAGVAMNGHEQPDPNNPNWCCGTTGPVLSATATLGPLCELDPDRVGLGWTISVDIGDFPSECAFDVWNSSSCRFQVGMFACPKLFVDSCQEAVSVVVDTGCVHSPDNSRVCRGFCQVSITPNLILC